MMKFVPQPKIVLRSAFTGRARPSFSAGFTGRGICHIRRRSSNTRLDTVLQVLVRDNNVDQALRVLKKRMQREGIFREMKQRRAYEKPSERKTREKAEAIRRARKAARKQAQREGLLPMPKRKIDEARGRGRPGGFGGGAGAGGGPRPGGFGGSGGAAAGAGGPR